MLPLSGSRLAASRSNSSTREPSITTTRVSSGWAASISMRLVMGMVLRTAAWPEASGARAAEKRGDGRGHGERTAEAGKLRCRRGGGQAADQSSIRVARPPLGLPVAAPRRSRPCGARPRGRRALAGRTTSARGPQGRAAAVRGRGHEAARRKRRRGSRKARPSSSSWKGSAGDPSALPPAPVAGTLWTLRGRWAGHKGAPQLGKGRPDAVRPGPAAPAGGPPTELATRAGTW